MYGFNELKRKLTETLTNVARVWGQPVVTWGLRKSKTVVKTIVSHDDEHDHHRHHRHHHEHYELHAIIMTSSSRQSTVTRHPLLALAVRARRVAAFHLKKQFKNWFYD